MPILQCPACDLRFTSEGDLDDHLRRDHPDFQAEQDEDEPDNIYRKARGRHPRS